MCRIQICFEIQPEPDVISGRNRIVCVCDGCFIVPHADDVHEVAQLSYKLRCAYDINLICLSLFHSVMHIICLCEMCQLVLTSDLELTRFYDICSLMLLCSGTGVSKIPVSGAVPHFGWIRVGKAVRYLAS